MQIHTQEHDTEPLVRTPTFSVLKSMVAQARKLQSGGYDGLADERGNFPPTPEHTKRQMVGKLNRPRFEKASSTTAISNTKLDAKTKRERKLLMEFVLQRSQSQNDLPEKPKDPKVDDSGKGRDATLTKKKRRKKRMDGRRSRSKELGKAPRSDEKNSKKTLRRRSRSRGSLSPNPVENPRNQSRSSDDTLRRRSRSRGSVRSRRSVPLTEEKSGHQSARSDEKPPKKPLRPRSRSRGGSIDRAIGSGEAAERGLTRLRSARELKRSRSQKKIVNDSLNATLHSLDFLRSQDKENILSDKKRPLRRSGSMQRKRTPSRSQKKDDNLQSFVQSLETLKLKEMKHLQQNLKDSSCTVQFLPSLVTSEDQKGLSSSLDSLDLKYLQAEDKVVLVKGKGELGRPKTQNAELSSQSCHGSIPSQSKNNSLSSKTHRMVQQPEPEGTNLELPKLPARRLPARSASLEDLKPPRSPGSNTSNPLLSKSCHERTSSPKARPPVTRRVIPSSLNNNPTFDGLPSVLKAMPDRRTFRASRDKQESASFKIKMPKSRAVARSLSLNKGAMGAASMGDTPSRTHKLRRGNSAKFPRTSSSLIGPALKAAIQ